MLHPKANPSSFLTQDSQFLYVFGGTIIERYHIATGFTGWEQIQCQMPQELEGLDGFVVVPAWEVKNTNANLYIFGGSDQNNPNRKNSDIFEFNPDTLQLYKTEFHSQIKDEFSKPFFIDHENQTLILVGRKNLYTFDTNNFLKQKVYEKKGLDYVR